MSTGDILVRIDSVLESAPAQFDREASVQEFPPCKLARGDAENRRLARDGKAYVGQSQNDGGIVLVHPSGEVNTRTYRKDIPRAIKARDKINAQTVVHGTGFRG